MEPIDKLDKDDPGDDVQLRFHYQHGYGAILAISSITNINDFNDFWFEQFEDILCKDIENLFHYYQIKTRNPELGAWKLSDKALKGSLQKFTKHEEEFSTVSKAYYFVSNTKFLETGEDVDDKTKLANSPINFFNTIKTQKLDKMASHYKDKFDDLLTACSCTEKVLLDTLKKTNLIIGPSKESIDSDLSSIHLFGIDKLKSISMQIIHKIRDEIILEIYKASSNIISDPRIHLFDLAINSPENPIINSKKMTKAYFNEIINNHSSGSDIFRFLPNREVKIGTSRTNSPILTKKLVKAGLSRSLDSMERRTLSAEYNLLELSNKNTDYFEEVLGQLESVVLTEHNDYEIMNTNEEGINSKQLMADFVKRMKEISSEEKKRVYGQNHDMLIGISGLLTGECKIWWCEQFDLSEDI